MHEIDHISGHIYRYVKETVCRYQQSIYARTYKYISLKWLINNHPVKLKDKYITIVSQLFPYIHTHLQYIH